MTVPGSPHDPARIRLLHILTSHIEEGRTLRGSPIRARIMTDQALDDARALIKHIGNSAKDLDAQGMLGEFYWNRFAVGEAAVDLRKSVSHYSALYVEWPDAVRAEVREYLDRIESWMDRADELMDRAPFPGGEAALDEAINILREVIQLVIDGDPALPTPFTGLAVALERRFNLTRRARPRSTDLDDALAAIDRAIELSRPDDEQLPMRHTFRIRFLGTEYDQTDNVSTLEEAIRIGTQLLVSSHDHPDPATLNAEVAQLYKRRYDRTMAIADIDTAISHLREALRLSSDDGLERYAFMDDLGVVLRRRGEHVGDTETLDEAVERHHRAVDGYPVDHIDGIMVRHNLGRALLALGDATTDHALVGQAVEVLRRVVTTAIERSHPDLAGFQQDLAFALNTRFRVAGDVSALEEQVATLREASTGLEKRPGAARDLGSDLGNAMRRLAEQTDDPALLNHAIATQQQAVSGFSPDDPAAAMVHSNLARALHVRYERTADYEDRTKAIELFQSVAQLDAAPSWLRARAARRWGELDAKAGNWEGAETGLSLAVELLPRLAAQNLQRGDQERHLMHEPGLVADAVAAALHTGKVERAAVLFERGRGVLTAQAMDLRTDLTELTQRDAGLAAEFTRLRDALDLAGDSDRRRLWANEWDELLQKIRNLEGFADFLRALTAEQIRAAACDGPIVMVNVSDYRSDAIVVQTGGIDVVPLPLVTRKSTESEWISFVVGVDMSVDEDLLTAEQLAKAAWRVRAGLQWLWDAIVGPVLTQLGLAAPPVGKPLGRMWWLPSALLNFLPLHAAGGRSDTGVAVSALDLVISSYTPTVRSLLRVRERGRAIDSAIGPLVVAMPNTPGMGDLPGAREDAEYLQQTFPGVGTLINERAMKNVVLEKLPEHPWVHFSCHGDSDRVNPSASHLFVAEAEELTVLEVSRKRVDGEFAFLAACRTSQSGLALVDEAVHLAGAFQLAGYRHVLAAMWPIEDKVALSISRCVYTQIRPGSTSVKNAAKILHDAVRKIRNELPEHPVLWASYVHLGP